MKKSSLGRGGYSGESGDSDGGSNSSAEETIPAARPPFAPAAAAAEAAAAPSIPSPVSSSPPLPPAPPLLPRFSIARMQPSDIPEVLHALASAFPAEVEGLGLSEAAFVELHCRLLATKRGIEAFGVVGVAREAKERGAFLGVVVVQGAGGEGGGGGGGEAEEEETEAAASTSSSSSPPPPPLTPTPSFLSRLRSLRARFSSVRSLCGVRAAALSLARDLLLPESLADDELLLEYLAVSPRARGRGVGRALLAFAVAEAQRWGEGEGAGNYSKKKKKKTALTLWVDAGNEAALALYFSAGFRRVPGGAAAGGGGCAGCGSGKAAEEAAEEEEAEEAAEAEESDEGAVTLSPASSSPLAVAVEAAKTLYHRALCRFFLGSSRWVRLALPLGRGTAGRASD